MSGTQYVRKLATAAAVSLALASGGAFGLGLGDIEMRSALNQPMQAEIRLTAVKPGELEGMVVQLASADAFARAGIERSSVLTDLSFSVDNSGSVPVIRIASNQPVVEPFLNFLLEVDWSQGRMIREYTVLLDPPVFMTSTATSRNTAGDQAAVVQRGTEALIVPTPIDRSSSFAGEVVEMDLLSPSEGELIDLEVVEGGQQFDGQAFQVDSYDSSADGEIVSLSDLSAPNTGALQQFDQSYGGSVETFDGFEVEVLGGTDEVGNEVGGFLTGGDDSTVVSLNDLNPSNMNLSGESVTVRRGDTLYEIATSTAVGGASVQQMMMALLKANDSSFINSNVNLLKAGSTLQVPDSNEVNQMNQAEAVAAISEQKQLWQDYRDQLRSGSGTRQASSGTSQDPVQVALYSEDGDQNASISDRAQAIIDNARDEVRDREELKLIADSDSASSASNAAADENSSDSDSIGEINRKLQLAREELSSTRLQSGELSDQASELLDTSDNLDSLVELRQTGVANLEAQLADARKNGEDTVEGVGNMVDGIGDSGVDLLADASDGAGDFLDSGTNALTEAGEDLSQVQLLSEDGEEIGLQTNGQFESPETTAWYQDILANPMKLLLGAGALLGLLGLGALLFWRRRRADDVEEVEFGDDVEFIDDEEADELRAEMNQDRFDEADDFDDFGEVGTATVANHDYENYDSVDEFDSHGDTDFSHEQAADREGGFGSGLRNAAGSVGAAGAAGVAGVAGIAGLAGASSAAAKSSDELDQDDTISEADVYLNYGLHGQAEELLNKAVETQPNNPEYARKLLETYHGQGNGEKYVASAKNFHARFGGESNPEWAGIAADGAELVPGEPLFENASNQFDTLQTGFANESAKSNDNDYQSSDESFGDSFDRSVDQMGSDNDSIDEGRERGGFGVKAPVLGAAGAAAAGFASLKSKAAGAMDLEADETDLMDQSLDPAFAFDEADLEATGDFSQIADELAAEGRDNVEFPSFDETLSDTSATATGVRDDFLDSTITDPDALGDAMTMDEVDGVIGSADDLTLDLDQLTGDLELDSAELMNPELNDIELQDMTFNDDLGASGLEARVASNDADAMETMLDLAKAYIDMGDKDSASSALDEIVKSGNPAQVSEAEILKRKIS